jgi:hypothetical protein
VVDEAWVAVNDVPSNIRDLASHVGVRRLPGLVARYLLGSVCSISEDDSYWETFDEDRWEDALRDKCVRVGKVSTFHSVTMRYYSPIDLDGSRGGELKEIIRANPHYRGDPRYDTILIETDPERTGMSGLDVAQLKLVFTCQVNEKVIPLVLIQWFQKVSDTPDRDTGMWIVEREACVDQTPHYSVLHIDCIFRSVHLLPVFGPDPVTTGLGAHDVLQEFPQFFVNAYSDYHLHEVIYDVDTACHSIPSRP